MNEVLFTILEGIVVVSILLLMRFVLPYISVKLNSVIDDELFKEILKAVKSVEQDSDFIYGADKKSEVITRITDWAIDRGIKVTYEQVSQLVETAVWVMKNEGKKDE